MATKQTRARLAYLRRELRAGRMSYGEQAELQSLADQIDPGDVELLEAAGVPEFPCDIEEVTEEGEATAKYYCNAHERTTDNEFKCEEAL